MSDILHIVYGTQTGTAEELAFDIEKLSKEKGFKSEVFELDDITMDKLQEIKKLLIVTSTTGDGEVPDNGLTFWENLSSLNELNISNLKYGVLALGDSSHYDFCYGLTGYWGTRYGVRRRVDSFSVFHAPEKSGECASSRNRRRIYCPTHPAPAPQER